ncbi:MAG: hypothetical protein PHF70_08840 [Opitutales bacterium]|nr:hypothetical protein [Opitutales bacterium]
MAVAGRDERPCSSEWGAWTACAWGKLPHWEQGPVWNFVTFRLKDALPRAVVEEIRLQRDQWLSIDDLENLTREDLVDYHRMFSQRYVKLLNEGSQSNSHPKNEICLLWGNASVLNGIAVRVWCPFRFSYSGYIDDLSGLSVCEFCVSVVVIFEIIIVVIIIVIFEIIV